MVREGETGFLVEDEAGMAAAVGRLDEIDARACRAACEERFGVPAVVAHYEEVYRSAAERDAAVAF